MNAAVIATTLACLTAGVGYSPAPSKGANLEIMVVNANETEENETEGSCSCKAELTFTPTHGKLVQCANGTYGIQVTWESNVPKENGPCDIDGIHCSAKEDSQCSADFTDSPLVVTQHNCLAGVQLESRDPLHNNGNWRMMTSGDTFSPTFSAKCDMAGGTDAYSIIFRQQAAPNTTYTFTINFKCNSCTKDT